MLNVFRRYERYIYITITIVIVISFSFFGTYSTLQRSEPVDFNAITAVDGSSVKRSEIEEMTLFLGTDAEDKLMFGGIWGPNFLNDGVIKKDILETGLGEILAINYASGLEKELKTKHEREKNYVPYTNAQAPFISVTNIWDHFIPQMHEDFVTVQKNVNPTSPQALSARIRLFLEARNLPPYLLRQVIRYQEKQFSWLTPDPRLDSLDLSLFGYHTVEDWFGGNFIRIVAQFIINSAKIAQEQGFKVTKDEALADLIRNAELSFRSNYNNPNLGVANSTEYFDEQLRRMGLDRSKAIKLWQNVLLFRRLFPDTGNGAIIDPLLFQKFQGFAKETLQGNLYQLPEDLRIGNFYTLQLFETYLKTIARNSNNSPLSLPNTFLSVAEVEEKNPELVQRRYLLEISSINRSDLQSKVAIRDMWDWQMKNWDKLEQQFPELAKNKLETTDQRINLLDSLDVKTRSRIDAYSRQAIVDAHPEWIQQSLQQVTVKKQSVGLRKKGASIFAGLKDPSELIALLDSYPESQEKLANFTADDNTFYKIKVVENSTGPEILTFNDAQREGVLDQLLNKNLKEFYEKNKSKLTAQKTFEEAKAQVAALYFAPLLNAIQEDYLTVTSPEKAYTQLIPDVAASLRFYAYIRNAKDQIEKQPESASEWVRTDAKDGHISIQDQWKLVKVPFKTDRTVDNSVWNEKIFALAEGNWSTIATPANGDLKFFHLNKKVMPKDLGATSDMVFNAQQLLSQDAQRVLALSVLKEIQKHKAISLDYLIKNEPQE